MKLVRPLAGILLASLALTGCSSNSNDSAPPAVSKPNATYLDGTKAVVQEVQNGNTFTAKIGDAVKSVRLINLLAPSANIVETSGNCLVNESTDFLKSKLPTGTEVTLNFDPTQVGASGYVLAAVYVGSDFINKDVAGAGMVATTYSSQSDKFYPEISGAQQQAAQDGVGLYSKTKDCTIPYALQQQIDAVHNEVSLPNDDARAVANQKASALYNQLTAYMKNPSSWGGSIVTLTAVQSQLMELKTALGANYYDEKGMTAAQKATAAATAAAATGRPGAGQMLVTPAPAESSATPTPSPTVSYPAGL